MDINRADAAADVAAAFAAYEKALVDGDVARMTELFWNAPDVVRFGIADRQSGADELWRWRRAQPPLPPGRTLVEPRITTFGDDFAVVTTRFTYPGQPGEGRQSQTWVRLAQGWRIVSAHVSYPAGMGVHSGR